MKFYTLAMFVFLLSLSFSIIKEMDIINYESAYTNQEWIDSISGATNNSNVNYDYLNQSYTETQLSDNTDAQDVYRDSRLAFKIFGQSIYYSTIGLPNLLKGFGLNGTLATLFSLPLWIVYFVAIIQLLFKFGWEGIR